MKKRDFETYHKRFRDFEILTKFSETHVFRGTIHHPYYHEMNDTTKPKTNTGRIRIWHRQFISTIQFE